MLAASFAANAVARAASELMRLGGCLGFSIFEDKRGCPSDRLTRLRSGLRVTSMTVGEASALEARAGDGALFYPDADTGS